jgi:DNA invertase Pin-like site-specific DNA recombinase
VNEETYNDKLGPNEWAEDTLVDSKLDRLGRDLRHLINTVHDLTALGTELT